jgi:hypothetical protein
MKQPKIKKVTNDKVKHCSVSSLSSASNLRSRFLKTSVNVVKTLQEIPKDDVIEDVVDNTVGDVNDEKESDEDDESDGTADEVDESDEDEKSDEDEEEEKDIPIYSNRRGIKYSKGLKETVCRDYSVFFTQALREGKRFMSFRDYCSKKKYWKLRYGLHEPIKFVTANKWFHQLGIKSEHLKPKSDDDTKRDAIQQFIVSGETWLDWIKKNPLGAESTLCDWKRWFDVKYPKVSPETDLLYSDMDAIQLNVYLHSRNIEGNDCLEIVDEGARGRGVKVTKTIEAHTIIAYYGKVTTIKPEKWNPYHYSSMVKINRKNVRVWVVIDHENPQYGEFINHGLPTGLNPNSSRSPNVDIVIKHVDGTLTACVRSLIKLPKNQIIHFNYGKDHWYSHLYYYTISSDEEAVINAALENDSLSCWKPPRSID